MKVYVLRSYDYEESEILGVYANGIHALDELMRIGHRNVNIHEYDLIEGPAAVGCVGGTVSIHTGVYDEEPYRHVMAYLDMPSKWCPDDESDDVSGYSKYTNNRGGATEYYTARGHSVEQVITRLKTLMGELYTDEIDKQLREEYLPPTEALSLEVVRG